MQHDNGKIKMCVVTNNGVFSSQIVYVYIKAKHVSMEMWSRIVFTLLAKDATC